MLMTRKNLLLSLGICTILILGMAVFAVNPAMAVENPEEGFAIGFSQMESNMPFRVAENESLLALEDEYPGVEVYLTDAQGSVAKQISDAEDLLARGVDVLVIAPREYEGFQSVWDAAKRAGVPVILIDREAAGIPGEDFETFIGADFWMEGRQAGVYLSAKMEGEGKIIELTGTSGASVARDRQGGFEEVIGYFPEMEIIASQTADFTRMEGLNVMENLIQRYGSEIDAVYAHNDEMALGAIEALESSDLDPADIWIASIDGTTAAQEAIIDGKLDVSVECSPFFGPIVYETAKSILRGEDVPTSITMTDATIYTPENVAEYYNPDAIY